jgi:hypothetical protein
MEYIFLIIGIIFIIDAVSTITNPVGYLHDVARLNVNGHGGAVPKTPFGRFLASGCLAGMFFYLAYHFWD